jgi:TetR/AcrR family transcriptional regulator, transcriptional repressor of bet genes
MPRRKLPEETRREDILRAAYDVAARRGVEALTLRAVADRAGVSHGTVLFHFKRRQQLVASLLDRVIYATIVLRIPDAVDSLTRPSEKLHELLRTEIERLSNEARHFRLFLEYWTLGVRNLTIRRKLNAALEAYRAAFADLARAVIDAERNSRSGGPPQPGVTPDGVASVAVSLVHGCALQAVIAPREFALQPHFDTASRLLDHLVATAAT